MSDVRQIPLFGDQPARPEDINLHTQMQHTIALFQQQLIKDGKSQHTVSAFTSDLQLLAEHTGGDTPVGEYTTNRLNDFLDWLEHGRGVSCSRKSYARRVTTLKVYFKWLRTIGAIPLDPALAILQRSGPAPLANALSRDDLAACLHAARQMRRGGADGEIDMRPELLLRLIADTGIKKSEAMALTAESIDRQNPMEPALVIRYKVRNVFKERRIALDPDWLPLLDRYTAQYQPSDTLFACTARNLEYVLAAIGDAADLPYKLSFETLRWTCAVRDTRHGMEEAVVRDKLGLSPISWQETRAKIKRLIELQVAEETRR